LKHPKLETDYENSWIAEVLIKNAIVNVIAHAWHVHPILFHTHSLCSDYHLATKTSPPSDVTCVSNRSSKSTVVDDQGGESTDSECEYDTNHE